VLFEGDVRREEERGRGKERKEERQGRRRSEGAYL
jgi:hypothetical protein